MIKAKLLPATMAFLGWFGPRGLATVVFFLVAVEETGMADERELALVTLTVSLSILFHGLSAKPASDWLAGKIEAAESEGMEDMGEMEEVYAHPMRSGPVD